MQVSNTLMNCQWVEDAFQKKICNKVLGKDLEYYCPKHLRVFNALIKPRLEEIKEQTEDSKLTGESAPT